MTVLGWRLEHWKPTVFHGRDNGCSAVASVALTWGSWLPDFLTFQANSSFLILKT